MTTHGKIPTMWQQLLGPAISEELIHEAHMDAALIKQDDSLVIDNMHLANMIAKRAYRKMPRHIDFQDVRSAAYVGLVDAAQKFDKTKKVKFESYAQIRINGAITDWQRSMDWVPRFTRRAIKEGNAVLENEIISWPDDLNGEDKDLPERQNLYPVEIRIALDRAIEELPEREGRLLEAVYFAGDTQADLAKIEGCCETRVSQLVNGALDKLKVVINEGKQMPTNEFSDVICECGCGNKLLKSIADAGWKYIYGHKNKGITVMQEKPKQTVINLPVIENFFESSLLVLNKQIAEQMKIRDTAETMIEQLMAKQEKILQITELTKELAHG